MSTTDTPCLLAVAVFEAISDQYGPLDNEDRAAFFESFDSSSPDQGFYIGSMEFWILDESERGNSAYCLNGYDGVELEACAELDGSNAWRWIYRTN